MNQILKVQSVGDYSSFVGHVDTHQFVAVIDYAEVSPILHTKSEFSVYALFLLDDTLEDLTYGHSGYGYEKGTLVCVSPGQTGGVDYNGKRFDRRGWALLFHPDLLQGTPLGYSMKEYSFFQYQTNEALYMTESEREIYISLLLQLRRTLGQNNNKYRDSIIVTYIELILKYCKRFYDRQFTAREASNHDLLKRFNHLLSTYLNSERLVTEGIPTVAWCAKELCLSPSYFGDLVKKETGITARDHIHHSIIEMAKNKLINGEQIIQIAYDLGFEYPQHLSRLFKKQTGCTPSEYIERISKA